MHFNSVTEFNFAFFADSLPSEIEGPKEPITNKTEAIPKKKYSKEKLKLMKIEEKTLDENVPQHSQEVEGPQFSKIKLKKPSLKPKQETTTVTLPKVQLKSRIRYINDWPPQIMKPVVNFLGSVRQNGDMSRNVKEALKLKKKVLKIPKIPDLEKVELEKPEQFDFSSKTYEAPSEYEVKHIEYSDHEIPEMIKDDIPKENEPKTDIKESVPTKLDKIRNESSMPEIDYIDLINKKELESVSSLSEASTDEEIKPDIHIEEESLEISEVTPKDIVEKPVKLKKKDKPKVAKLTQEVTKDKPQEKEMVPEIISQENKIIPETIESPKVSEPDDKQDVAKPQDKEDEQKIILSDDVIENRIPKEKDTKTRKKTKKVIKTKKDEIQQPEVQAKPSIQEEKKPDLEEETTPSLEEDIALEEHVLLEPLNTNHDEPKKILPVQQVKPKPKLTPMKIERKVLEIGKAQHAENIDGPQFTKLKLKKAAPKPKPETQFTSIPKFQLKSRITYIKDWPPAIINPLISFLGSVRQNGILSRNVKEASKIKKKVYKQPDLPEAEKTELEKPMFGHEDIIGATKQNESKPEEGEEITQEEPEQFTIKPRRPSVKKTEEITEEITIKKKLKPIRKSSIILPEITEPETVTFRPKSTKTKEDVEQEFNIQLDSYAEEEISMSSKVKLKPQRQPTFSEEANETSIKFYEEEDGPDIVEVIESDVEDNEKTTQVMMPLKKAVPQKEILTEDIMSSVTVSRPKTIEEPSELVQDISIKLDRKPKYTVDDQEEVSFEVKPLTEQYSTEELSLSSKIKLKPRKKVTVSEAADETSIQITQEVEDENEQEEIILSESESEENVEMVIRRKPKKPAYEVSEIEEQSVEFKPKPVKDDNYHKEQLTISAKRKPRKPSQLQGIVCSFVNMQQLKMKNNIASLIKVL